LASTWPTEVELLRELVAIPSVSGEEAEVARFVEARAHAWGLSPVLDEAGVSVRVPGKAKGATLALVSHLDVVPPGTGWSRDPFTPVIEGGRLYGRGSGDAKASVAAMLCAANDVAERGGPERGDLLLLFGLGEETRHTTMPALVGRAGSVDAAVVGEPTDLDLAVAQRGLMMVDLVARGDQRHAGRAGDDGPFTNALTALARDLVRLDTLFRENPHPTLGHPTVTPTMVEAGVSRNVTPPFARAVLDVRSTPLWDHAALADGLRQALESDVVVTSDRLVPCETPAGSRLLAAAAALLPGARQYGSPTCSDWVFLRHVDAVKCGPGTSARSHTPDECVDLAQVSAARRFYAALAGAYLA
jgi:acetylornithine deacetylase